MTHCIYYNRYIYNYFLSNIFSALFYFFITLNLHYLHYSLFLFTLSDMLSSLYTYMCSFITSRYPSYCSAVFRMELYPLPTFYPLVTHSTFNYLRDENR